MPPSRSAEMKAVIRRVLNAWQERDYDTMSNLFSSDASLRVNGFDDDERWMGHEEFFGVFRFQSSEMPYWKEEIESVDAFEDRGFGWASVFGALITAETQTPIRHSAVLGLEAGAWRVLQWLNSIPVPNQQVFGVELTTTLGDLVTSVLENRSQLASAAGSKGP